MIRVRILKMKWTEIMKVRFTVEKLFFVLIFSMLSGLFLITSLNIEHWRNFAPFIAVACFIYYFFHHNQTMRSIDSFAKRYMQVFLVIIIYESIYSSNLYNYSIMELMYSLRGFVLLVLVLPIFVFCKVHGGIDDFLKMFQRVILLSVLLRVFVWTVYTLTGIPIFTDLLFENTGVEKAAFRNNLLRIDPTHFWPVLEISLLYFYNKTKKRKYMIFSLALISFLIVLSQTRTYILQSLVYFVVMIYLNVAERIKNSSKIYFYFISFAIGIFSLVIILTPILSYLGLDTGIMGLQYRYWEIKHFLGMINENNIFHGIGILSGINDVSNSLLYTNYGTKLYLGDVGMLESFVQFGCLAVPLYVGLWLYIFKTIKKCKRVKMKNEMILLTGFFTYSFVGSLTLDLFDGFKIANVPIIIGLCAYICSKCNEVKKQNI